MVSNFVVFTFGVLGVFVLNMFIKFINLYVGIMWTIFVYLLLAPCICDVNGSDDVNNSSDTG